VRRISGVAAVVAVVAMAPAHAGAATQLGETFSPPNNLCDPIFTYVQSGSPASTYTAPFDGVITSWSHQADATPAPVRFKVARPAGGSSFTIVGESALITPGANQLLTELVRLPVNAGDVIGILSGPPGNADCGRIAPAYTAHYRPSDAAIGTTAAFNGPTTLQLDVAATLEPDCDRDGLGDETQDPSADCAAPETAITKQPKDKTKKKQAEFEFTSSEPGSSFECALDGSPFAACTSPLIRKVSKGKHVFQVRAADPVGNVDGSPAIDDWKVKKKPKK
jgi:hypothetical protein